MTLKKLVAHVNRIVGKGNYRFSDLVDYFDECVDAINVDLSIALPLFSEVYENNFDKTEAESAMLKSDGVTPLFQYPLLENGSLNLEYDGEEHIYTRIPDPYLRGYVAQEAAHRILKDEDEDDEVLRPKIAQARLWYQRLVSIYNDVTLEDTEAVSIGGDVDELTGTSVDDTGVGFYNPLFPYDD